MALITVKEPPESIVVPLIFPPVAEISPIDGPLGDVSPPSVVRIFVKVIPPPNALTLVIPDPVAFPSALPSSVTIVMVVPAWTAPIPSLAVILPAEFIAPAAVIFPIVVAAVMSSASPSPIFPIFTPVVVALMLLILPAEVITPRIPPRGLEEDALISPIPPPVDVIVDPSAMSPVEVIVPMLTAEILPVPEIPAAVMLPNEPWPAPSAFALAAPVIAPPMLRVVDVPSSMANPTRLPLVVTEPTSIVPPVGTPSSRVKVRLAFAVIVPVIPKVAAAPVAVKLILLFKDASVRAIVTF
jgi:hypothetical protein